jgi:hypothetical protein
VRNGASVILAFTSRSTISFRAGPISAFVISTSIQGRLRIGFQARQREKARGEGDLQELAAVDAEIGR